MSQGNKPNGKEEMQSEYDIRGGVRGKYYNRYQQGASVVLLGPTEFLTRDQVQVILDSGDFDALIGAVENDWLECKAAPYRTKEEHQKLELAKDVSALANASGGIILIGLKTQREPTHFGDQIREARSFPQRLVNANQYHDILKSWIYPTPQQVEIRWYPSHSDRKKGILAICIPVQVSVDKPFLLTRTLDAKGKRVEIVFGHVERRRSGVDPRSVERLHALIRDGFQVDTLSRRLENIEATLAQIGSQQVQAKSEVVEAGFSHLLEERVAAALIGAELSNRRSFSLGAIPMEPIEIPTLFESRDADLVRLLENPPELRNAGFDLNTGSSVRIVRGQLQRAVAPEAKIIELWRDGTVIFAGTADEDFLCWGRHSTIGGGLRINPLALVESTYLFAELSRRIFESGKPQPTVLQYRLALENLNPDGNPCLLTPGPLGSFSWQFGTETYPAPASQAVFSVKWADLPIRPGRLAFLLVREVYRWFGIEDNAIPYTEQEDDDFVISAEKIRKAGS